MRSFLVAALLSFAGCAPVDAFSGTFNVTMTGTEMQTAPTNATNNITGTGTVVVTKDKAMEGYLISFGQDFFCMLRAKKNATDALKLDIAGNQTCRIGGSFMAMTSSGSLSVDKETTSVVTFTVAYSYSGQLVFNVAGTGTRTYTGSKL